MTDVDITYVDMFTKAARQMFICTCLLGNIHKYLKYIILYI